MILTILLWFVLLALAAMTLITLVVASMFLRRRGERTPRREG